MKPLAKLKNIAEKLNVPYGIHQYTGESPEFCVYEIQEYEPALFADNRAHARIAHARLDYTLPANKSYDNLIWDISDMLVEAGFTDPVISVNHEEKYTTLQFSSEIKA